MGLVSLSSHGKMAKQVLFFGTLIHFEVSLLKGWILKHLEPCEPKLEFQAHIKSEDSFSL